MRGRAILFTVLAALCLATTAGAANLWDTYWDANELPQFGASEWNLEKVTIPADHCTIVPVSGSNNAMYINDGSNNALNSFFRQRVDPAEADGTTVEVRFNPEYQSFYSAINVARIACPRGVVQLGWNGTSLVTVKPSLSVVMAMPVGAYYTIRLTEDGAGNYNLYVDGVLKKTGVIGAYTTEPANDRNEIGFGEFGSTVRARCYFDYVRIEHEGAFAPGDVAGPASAGPYISQGPTASIGLPGEVDIAFKTSIQTMATVYFRQLGTQNWSTAGSGIADNHNVHIAGLRGGAPYEYYVEVTDTVSVWASAIKQFTPAAEARILYGTAFGAMADIPATGGLHFTWRCTVDADSYVYYRPVGSGTWTEVYDATVVPAFDTGNQAATTHSILVPAGSLTPGTSYEWYVRSTNPTWGEAESEVAVVDYVFALIEGPIVTSLDGTTRVFWETNTVATEKLYYRVMGTGTWTEVLGCTSGCGVEHWITLTSLATPQQYEYYVQTTSEVPGFGTITTPIGSFETYAPPAGTNLLTNGGFETGAMAPWVTFRAPDNEAMDFRIGQGNPAGGFHHNAPHSGLYRLEGGSQGKHKPIGVYQQFAMPGAGTQTLSASAWVLTHELAVKPYIAYGYSWTEYVETHVHGLFRIGIDPTGGTDYTSENIVWSAPVHTFQKDKPYVPIAVSTQVNGGSTVTVFVKCIDHSVDAAYQMPLFIDDVWASTNPGLAVPANITVTESNPMSATFSWTTPVPANSMVQHTVNGGDDLWPESWFAYDPNLTTNHSVTVTNRFIPGVAQKYRVQSFGTSGANSAWFVSDLRNFQTQPNNTLVNGDFEASGLAWDQDIGFGIAAIPWVKFGSTTGTSGFAGIVRDASYSLHGIHPTSLSHALVFEEGFATNDNFGGAYQRIKIGAGNIGKLYMAKGQVNTYSESASATDVANRIGIDPTGGVDATAGTVMWGPWVSTSRAWGQAICAAIASSEYVTVFLQTAHKWAIPLNLTMFDDVSMEVAVPVTSLEQAKNKEIGWPVELGASGNGIIVTKIELMEEGYPVYPTIVGWVQEDDKSNGMKVRLDMIENGLYIARGDRLRLVGTTNRHDLTDFNWGDTELIVQKADVLSSFNNDPTPLTMTTEALAGAAYGIQRGATGGSGANNIGLLVKVVGTVVAQGYGVGEYKRYFFYLDDGAGVACPEPDNTTGKGVKIWMPEDYVYWQQMPQVGTLLTITGVACLDVYDPTPGVTGLPDGSGDELLVPTIRMRDGADMQVPN